MCWVGVSSGAAGWVLGGMDLWTGQGSGQKKEVYIYVCARREHGGEG